MSKSISEMNLKEFIEYFEEISGIVGVDFDDDNLATRTLHFLKEYEGVAAVKSYTQEELNEAISKALNDMTKVLESKDAWISWLDKKYQHNQEALRLACEDKHKAMCRACQETRCHNCHSSPGMYEFMYLSKATRKLEEQNNDNQ